MSILDTPYQLDHAAMAEFDKNGFIKLPNVLDAPTISRFEPEITNKVIELNTQHLPISERATYGKAFLQVTNLWQHSELVREFVFSRRLAQIAADLLGVAGVRLYHDQALYKEAGGGITPWHADQYYWPLATDRSITVWVPLQPTPPSLGPLGFAAGSHRFQFGRDMPISDASEEALQKALREQEFEVAETPFELGEVSYHLGWTFHRAGENTSAIPRRVMTIIYIDADITVAEPVNDHQRADLRSCLGDAPIGSIPAELFNPIIYRR